MQNSLERSSSEVTSVSGGSSNKRILTKVSILTRLIWDEFFLCDPTSEKIADQKCPCENCFSDELIDLLEEVPRNVQSSTSAKCKAISQHIVFFCKQLHDEVVQKFPVRANSVTAEFLFSKWLLTALCNDANKTGLVQNVAITGALERNLQLVKDTLSALVASKEDYDVVMNELPYQLSEMCDSRRG